MKLHQSKIFVAFFSLILLGFNGCAPQEQGNTNTGANINTNAQNTTVATNTNAAKPPENKEVALAMPVTLPVLDAMFSDEQFANDLKTNLQLSDEQIQKLKQLSGESVKNLSDDETDNHSGSTRAETERANNEIRQLLGEEKANKFFELVRQRWEGDESGTGANNTASAAKPNALPTDSRIVVNAPAYRMDVFQDGKLVKTYKVGIGYPEFPLPKGVRKANSIIFNPTWTPPDEPWVKGKIKAGEKVEAGSKLNPLGPIKIPIGLPSLIHGGKSPARLGNFASHGCVGLTNSQVKDFALELAKLTGTELTAQDVANYEKQKTQTKDVKLKTPVQVELRYETIVIENGVLKIYRDVYERDTNTEENLRRVLEAYGVSLESLDAKDRENILSGLHQMASDAQGNPVDGNANSNSNANSDTKSANNKNKNANSNGGAVTRNVKGKKEVTFQLAQLQGKGYPAPVNLVSQ
ncbi:MAG TPA: L,D-transpeptidase [Pyrinomonadaceae bacterium]|jgi:lipoprotein-anchoring transpeptidase ErfK/SrfK